MLVQLTRECTVGANDTSDFFCILKATFCNSFFIKNVNSLLKMGLHGEQCLLQMSK